MCFPFLFSFSVKTYELRGKNKSELISTLDELKRELSEVYKICIPWILLLYSNASNLPFCSWEPPRLSAALPPSSERLDSSESPSPVSWPCTTRPSSLRWASVMCCLYCAVVYVCPPFPWLQLREKYAGEKHVPRDLRAKKTRAIRRRLTDEQVFYICFGLVVIDINDLFCRKTWRPPSRPRERLTSPRENMPSRPCKCKYQDFHLWMLTTIT